MALKEEKFECVFCMSIFKHLDRFLGENFIYDFLVYLKGKLTFKGILVLDFSYWKLKGNQKLNPERIKDILVSRLSFIFIDKVGGIG